MSFQRARKPEQKAQRRNAILVAAAQLVDEVGLQGAGLNALAARAGLTKSNLYRYFESREDVLLQLFLADLLEMVDQLDQVFPQLPLDSEEAVAEVLCQAYLSRPRLCVFLGTIASVLEQNVSPEVIANLKRQMLAPMGRMAGLLKGRLDRLSLADAGWVTQMIALLVAGYWPASQPAAAAQQVLCQAEFQCLKLDPRRDLTRAIAALLRGL